MRDPERVERGRPVLLHRLLPRRPVRQDRRGGDPHGREQLRLANTVRVQDDTVRRFLCALAVGLVDFF